MNTGGEATYKKIHAQANQQRRKFIIMVAASPRRGHWRLRLLPCFGSCQHPPPTCQPASPRSYKNSPYCA